jgi:hypothetical protein
VQLVEVLNEDYGEYVSLSSRLANVDGSVVRMRQPLIDTQVSCSSAEVSGVPRVCAAVQQKPQEFVQHPAC